MNANTHAIAVRDVDSGLRLFLRISRAPSGIYVVFAAGQLRQGVGGKAYNPHSSWHRDGRVHVKSYNRPWNRQQRQPLDSFEDAEQFVATSLDQAAAGLPTCEPGQFESVIEVPVKLLCGNPGHRLVHVDLVGPGAEPPPLGFSARLLRRWPLPGAPTIVISLYDVASSVSAANRVQQSPSKGVA